MSDTDKNPDTTEATETAGTELTAAESTADEQSAVAEPAEEPGAASSTEGEVPDRAGGGPLRGVRVGVGAIVLAAALIVSAGLTGWLYFNQYRPDQQTDPAAAQVALDAATSGTVALLSYSPESLDQDFAAAKTRLTGEFLSYYTQFTEQIVTPAAREKSVKTAASVVRAAVSEIQPESAEVLVFINQTTTSQENPDGAFAASSVKVGMEKIDGAWLIASFDPV